uniref:G protein-coupled receptor n=1 Tax=Parascaris univalens TaxID=6257 RepID=A0A914ZNX5_PARUN
HVVVKDAGCDMKTFMVLLMELFLSLIGAALCALTMVLLLRFNVFHVNQRILIANVALIVLFGSFYASLRAIIAVYQCESMPTPLSSSLGMDNERVAECYLRDSISPAIATAIAMSGLCIATERFYATLNFAVYEYQEMSYVVSTACVVTLLPIVFYVIGFLVSLCTGKVELTFSCAKPIDGDYIKENIVYIIAAFFDIIFLALYILLYFVSGFHILIEFA